VTTAEPLTWDEALDAIVLSSTRLIEQGVAPLLLENVPVFANDIGSRFVYMPEFICEVFSRVKDAGLLLDLGHGQVAACKMGIEPRDYFAQLPLHRVREIHISSPRYRPGVELLVDAHEALEPKDVALLEWVLERASPDIVTLEYQGTPDEILEQYHILHDRMVPKRPVA